jgi:hypothetical protein
MGSVQMSPSHNVPVTDRLTRSHRLPSETANENDIVANASDPANYTSCFCQCGSSARREVYRAPRGSYSQAVYKTESCSENQYG